MANAIKWQMSREHSRNTANTAITSYDALRFTTAAITGETDEKKGVRTSNVISFAKKTMTLMRPCVSGVLWFEIHARARKRLHFNDDNNND